MRVDTREHRQEVRRRWCVPDRRVDDREARQTTVRAGRPAACRTTGRCTSRTGDAAGERAASAYVRELGAVSFLKSLQPWTLFSQPWAVRSGADRARRRESPRGRSSRQYASDSESTSGFHSSGTELVRSVFVLDGRISMLTLPRAPPS